MGLCDSTSYLDPNGAAINCVIMETETVDLTERGSRSEKYSRTFQKSNLDKSCPAIDSDGLPHVGQRIRPDESYCSTYNSITNKTSYIKKKGTEDAYIDSVAVDVKKGKHLRKVS
ncbi:hypothetical protein TSUD_366200 [Trifolium subterraneum]|uniref:Uncharacterized protein n=1 Tax=Trifolium subterraneum TaxID=3900 RepID=A0A2Z6P099_TRISU|nr:hypothetical protein TSUD_366200 [Trifolium subterraneum]